MDERECFFAVSPWGMSEKYYNCKMAGAGLNAGSVAGKALAACDVNV